ncbi:MAG TPA: peptidylprolyl isomerase [Candidatus Dormibacteraeota bacterium]|nr:peptidylprolyl isomerase [Candidatus Dormibacteraeota bacterium]
MRRTSATLVLFLMAGSMAFGQAAATKPAAPAKPATAAKPATTAAAATKPTAIIDTTAGKMTCTLFPDKAPIGVANFIGLSNGTKDWKNPVSGATKHGVPLYDGTIFHRVIPQFMIQGGDPAGTGSGADPVAPFKNEVSPDLKFDQPGRLAYANAGPGTNTSQFFITEVAFTGQQGQMLNGNYTIFGQCDEASVALVKQIAAMSRDGNDRPYRPIKINHITIQKGTGAAKPAAATAAKKPTAATKAPAAPTAPKQ